MFMKHTGIIDGLGRTVIVEQSQAIFDAVYAPRGWVTATQTEADAFFGAPEPDDTLVTTAQLTAALAGFTPSGGSSVASSVALATVKQIDVTASPYNVRADVRKVTDVATTASSATITSATAAFTSADVGKTVAIYNPGSSHVRVVQATVASVTNGTTAVLSSTVASTLTSQRMVIGTDDTAGWQAAINAAAAQNGGVLIAPAAESLIAGAQVSGTVGGTSYSGQLLIPARNALTGPATITIQGANPVPLAFWQFNMPVEAGLSTLLSTATSGAIIDCIPSSGGSDSFVDNQFTNFHVRIVSMLVRGPNNPQCEGVLLNRAIAADFVGSAVTVDAGAGTIVYPTGTGTGLYLPEINNAAHVQMSRSQVYGWSIGLKHSEHACLDQVTIVYCKVAVRPRAAYHLASYPFLRILECTYGIQPTTGGTGAMVPTLIGNINFEYRAAGNTWSSIALYDDTNTGGLRGVLNWHAVRTDLGAVTSLAGKGGNNMSFARIYDGQQPSRQVNTLSDTFVRADNASVMGTADVTGQMWTPYLGTWGISSNKAYCAGGSNNGRSIVNLPNLPNPTLTCSITPSGAGAQAGFILRDNLTDYIAVELEPGPNRVRLQKYVSGSYTDLATSTAVSIVSGTAYAVVATVTQTTITVTVNGTPCISYTLTAGEQSIFNAQRWYGLFAYADTASRFGALTIQ